MKKPILITLIVVALLLIATSGLAAFVATRTTVNTTPQRINLPAATPFSTLVDTLQQRGIATSALPYRLCASLRQAASLSSPFTIPDVPAGSYLITPSTKALRLVDKFRRAQQDPVRITIPPVRTPALLSTYLTANLMLDSISIPDSLFHIFRPDTYEVYWTISADKLLARMQKEYNKFWNTTRRSKLANLNSRFNTITERDVIILASIIDEETNFAPERSTIASVYLNRLAKNMLLQADPTVKYAIGDFTLQRILNIHLQTPSPYNTYLSPGLPPSPIRLPLSATVDAVLDAPQTNYLYFCASPNFDGTHKFAATLAQHNRNAALYHQALSKLGKR